MKKTGLFVWLLLAAKLQAFAAGAFDAVYQHPTHPNIYLSVHQNGNIVLVARYSVIPPLVTTVDTVAGKFTPSASNVWDVFNGTIDAYNSVLATGETNAGACIESMMMTFDANSVAVTPFGIDTTGAGRAQGLDCASVYIGKPVDFTQVVYPRVF